MPYIIPSLGRITLCYVPLTEAVIMLGRCFPLCVAKRIMGYGTWAAGQSSKDQNIMEAFLRRMEYENAFSIYSIFALKSLRTNVSYWS